MLRRVATALRSPHARSLCVVRSIVTPDTIVKDWSPGSRRVGAIAMKCGMTQVRSNLFFATAHESLARSKL